MENVYPFPGHEEIRAGARAWVLKFNADTPPTDEEIAALREWAGRSAVHRVELERAQEFWSDADMLTALAVPLRRSDKAGRGLFDRIFSSLMLSQRRIAVVVVGFLAVALWFGLHPLSDAVGNGTYETIIGEQKILTLQDKSQIHLDTHSQIRVAYSDDRRNICLLDGKAYFQVAKDPQRPFEVYAGSGMVRAVGTGFSVYVTREDIKVTVDEGKVNLYRVKRSPAASTVMATDKKTASNVGNANDMGRNTQPVLQEIFLSLEKGESASFNQHEQTISRLAENELERELSWRRSLLIFTNDPLSRVVNEVSRYTPTQIEIVDPALNELKVGGRFNVGELEALFDALEAGFGVKITYVNKNHVQLRLASP